MYPGRLPRFVSPEGAAPPAAPSGLILPRGYTDHRQRVPSSQPGRDWIMCSAQECDRDADKRFKVIVPHETIKDHGSIYLFCSNRCRWEWGKGTPYEQFL